MAFSTRRGRPRSFRPSRDFGTPELVFKRLHRLTQEALDQCLEMGWVTAEQHWSGMHLRWLYTLRYGLPCPQAIDPTLAREWKISHHHDTWREEREQEYLEAIAALDKEALARQVLDVCIHDQLPLRLRQRAMRGGHQPSAPDEECLLLLQSLQTGLDLLSKLWRGGAGVTGPATPLQVEHYPS